MERRQAAAEHGAAAQHEDRPGGDRAEPAEGHRRGRAGRVQAGREHRAPGRARDQRAAGAAVLAGPAGGDEFRRQALCGRGDFAAAAAARHGGRAAHVRIRSAGGYQAAAAAAHHRRPDVGIVHSGHPAAPVRHPRAAGRVDGGQPHRRRPGVYPESHDHSCRVHAGAAPEQQRADAGDRRGAGGRRGRHGGHLCAAQARHARGPAHLRPAGGRVRSGCRTVRGRSDEQRYSARAQWRALLRTGRLCVCRHLRGHSAAAGDRVQPGDALQAAGAVQSQSAASAPADDRDAGHLSPLGHRRQHRRGRRRGHRRERAARARGRILPRHRQAQAAQLLQGEPDGREPARLHRAEGVGGDPHLARARRRGAGTEKPPARPDHRPDPPAPRRHAGALLLPQGAQSRRRGAEHRGLPLRRAQAADARGCRADDGRYRRGSRALHARSHARQHRADDPQARARKGRGRPAGRVAHHVPRCGARVSGLCAGAQRRVP